MKSMDEVRRIKAQVEAQLLKIPGVTGVDVGYKYVGDQKTDVPAIRVYVKRKHDAPAEEAIPQEIEGVPTDVIERNFVLHSQ